VRPYEADAVAVGIVGCYRRIKRFVIRLGQVEARKEAAPVTVRCAVATDLCPNILEA
jgi:hypothetical protein